jgi:5-(carboxyamino)imidazole ribonucleotide mutase
MADILVLFASRGDEIAFRPVRDVLDSNHIKYDFRMASAHKTPDDVEDILKKKYKLVITGAGLAAALPGVVAAKVLCPVIGVPCTGSLEGLDALLAIMQMPPGVPVLTTGVNNGSLAAHMAMKMLKNPKEAVLIGDSSSSAYKKIHSILQEFGVSVALGNHPKEDAVNIVCAGLDGLPKEKGITIYCPIVSGEDDKAPLALELLKATRKGLWVGTNNGTNAAIGAIEILNMDGGFEHKLVNYRKEQAEKVRAYSK